MNSSSKILYSLSAFLGLLSLVYIFGTMYMRSDASLAGAEWVGIVALVLSFGLTIFLGVYLHITSSRSDVLPEDWEEAEVEDKAGVLGFFSPGSIWPAVMSFAILALALGIALWLYWLMAVSAVVLIWACTKLNLQYGMPKEKH